MNHSDNNDLDRIQDLLPEVMPQNFCVAPFISTMQTTYGKTSPCAYGVTEWLMEDLTPAQRWRSTEYNQMRQQFAQDQVPTPCIKCLDEETAGKSSLRQRMREWFPNAYTDLILSGQWQQGPQLISTKVSNVCNLACRTCGGYDSNSYHREGLHYTEKYGTVNIFGNPGNRFVARLAPRHTDYSGFAEIDSNITKLEFYGGEPLLNLTHLDFLEHLVATRRSQDITIFYSTNCTQPINPRHQRLWDKFKKIEFSLSIDHIGDKFHYLRYPGIWSEVETNVNALLNLKNQISAEVTHVVSPCCTLLNAYYIDEVIDWAQSTVGAYYINMVANPAYLAVHAAPDHVKSSMLEHIKSSEVQGFIQVQPHNVRAWREFIIWTKRQDLYRQQNFAEVFPEFYSIIQDDWNKITDLSEKNLNNL